MKFASASCIAIATFCLGQSILHGFTFPVGVQNTWYDDELEKNLIPTWNTPIQGTPQAFPPPSEAGTGPVAVSLAEPVIGDDYFGWMGVTITGLSLGQPVRLELYRVDNDQQLINSTSVLVSSFEVADGVLSLTGERRNLNAVEDWDGDRDGKIYTEIGFFNGLHAVPGEYVARVSSPSDAFTPALTGLTINVIPTDTSFQGQVLDENDNPVPGALVGLLQPVGTGYSELIFSTVADENGRYTLYAPYSEEFELTAVAPGYVAPFSSGNAYAINDGEVIDLDIPMINAEQTVSGTVLNAVTNEPIPGLPITLMSVTAEGAPDGLKFTLGWTDADGQFSIQVTPGRWGVTFRTGDLTARNYLGPLTNASALVDTTAGAVSGLQIPLTPATCLISGVLENEDGEPLRNIQIFAFNPEMDRAASAYTFSDGSFTLPAGPGRWEVFPFSYDLEVANFPGSVVVPVEFSAANQSIRLTMSARTLAGVLEGNILDENDNPVGGLVMAAFNLDNGVSEAVAQRSYLTNGYFNFFLGSGNWAVYPIATNPQWHGLLVKGLPSATVPELSEGNEPVALPEKTIRVVTPTTQIEVSLRDPNDTPVPGVLMHAFMHDELGVKHDVFAQTDAAGIARVPVIAGEWSIHLSTSRLRAAGMREEPLFSVIVGGGPETMAVTTTPFIGEHPSITAALDAGGALVVSGTGEAGQTYGVEGTFDLENWFPMGRVTAIGGVFSITDHFEFNHGLFTDAPGADSGRVFYRVRKD